MSLHADARPADPDGLALESWAEGYMLGSLIIMAVITLANMRRGVLLHKLILLELIFGFPKCFNVFISPPVYGWWSATGGVLLNTSWSLHNVLAWMKNKPFLSRRVSRIYIWSVVAVQPYWVLEITATYLFYNRGVNLFTHTRPWEALFRDPWWIFTCGSLIYNIKSRYEFSIIELIRVSPRLGIMLASMFLSIVFMICDILAVTGVIITNTPDGVNPFWKLAFVFKCLTDTIVLDDFKTALDKLKEHHFAKMASARNPTDRRQTTLSERTSIELLDKCEAQTDGLPPGNIVIEQSIEITDEPRLPADSKSMTSIHAAAV